MKMTSDFRKRITVLILLLLTLPFAACGTLEVGVERTVTPTAAETATATVRATETVDLLTPRAVLETEGVANALPPGLVYWVEGELWKVNVDGQPSSIFAPSDVQALYLNWRTNARISPSGDQILYWDSETSDLWLVDLATGLRRNLTNIPKESECCFRWWLGRPGTIIFSTQSRELAWSPGTGAGFLGVVGVDGGGYRILDDHNDTYGISAPSPDGQTIAYGAGNTAWLYHWETGPEVFDPADYGLTGLESLDILGPAWSPDGKRLAWVVDVDGLSIGVGLFDLETRTTRLLHLYEPLGMDGWPPRPLWSEGPPSGPLWSPDGRWLAFTTLAQDPREMGLWVLQADGQGEEEILLATGRNDGLAWSPDGHWLVFTSTRQESLTWIVEMGTWSRHRVGLPLGAVVVDWLEMDP